eukprot:93725-Ditylum_brightwellii.AAC.1
MSGRLLRSQLWMDPSKDHCFSLGRLVIFSNVHSEAKSLELGINEIGSLFHAFARFKKKYSIINI